MARAQHASSDATRPLDDAPAGPARAPATPVPWVAIVNVRAGRGRAARTWDAVARELDTLGVPHEVHRTRGPADATDATRDAVLRGHRRFVAVGGDGTLHEVANGVLGSGARCTLAVVPNGTGNDWARGARIPRAPAALAAMLERHRVRTFDAGEIEYATPTGRDRRWFVNVAGCGYDAHVLERLSTRAPRGLAYLFAVASGLATYVPARFRVRTQGELAVDASLFVVFAALGRYCGGGMQFAPHADPTDGELDLVAIRHLGVLATLARLPKIYAGRVLEDPAVRHARTAMIEIDADPPVRVEADGQLLGTTPARVRVLPRALDCVVP